ncbi:tRNA (adenosine(37)-N6)-dimethylallyltransferase MiaA [Ureaplasma ceti]|uniref:tRNA dimethylallyltransferase n=1 Tax=Ureaplasma ceti TaxID=3119530 RepID=A0ABP9U8A4_9BACT
MQPEKKLIIIIGPTAAKKSRLAHLIAERFQGSVINGDAYQVYKEISAGINKPTQEEIEKYDYHLVNLISWNEEWSIAHFQKAFDNAYDEIVQRQRLPILCGGSHLYTDAIINGYDLSIDTTPYETEIANWTIEELYAYVLKYDPVSAEKIGPNNYKRLFRCVALLKANNNIPKSVTDLQNNKPVYKPLIIMVTKDRQVLYDKINARFDRFFSENNWMEEIQQLIEKDPAIIESLCFKAIGYQEIANSILNHTPVDTEKLKQKTRQLAKRQLTWCNNKFPDKLVFEFEKDDLEEIFAKVQEFYYD